MSTAMTVERAIIQKQIWKSPVMDTYVTALLTSALALYHRGTPYFNGDDVPESSQPGDGTTAGAAIRMLTVARIIEPWRGSVESAGIWGGMRRSTRECCNGHRNQLYALTNTGIAIEWLDRHGVRVEPVQGELALELP
jgi:hypothetical protein